MGVARLQGSDARSPGLSVHKNCQSARGLGGEAGGGAEELGLTARDVREGAPAGKGCKNWLP